MGHTGTTTSAANACSGRSPIVGSGHHHVLRWIVYRGRAGAFQLRALGSRMRLQFCASRARENERKREREKERKREREKERKREREKGRKREREKERKREREKERKIEREKERTREREKERKRES